VSIETIILALANAIRPFPTPRGHPVVVALKASHAATSHSAPRWSGILERIESARLRSEPALSVVDRAASKVAASSVARNSRDDWYRCRWSLGPERLHLNAVWADDAPARLRHFVPDAGNVAEGLGDDQPGVL
jgi:hypothetical protein